MRVLGSEPHLWPEAERPSCRQPRWPPGSVLHPLDSCLSWLLVGTLFPSLTHSLHKMGPGRGCSLLGWSLCLTHSLLPS